MPLKDCTLVISYVLAFVCIALFGNAMFSDKWIRVDGGKRRGLWKECREIKVNGTKPEPPDECSGLPLAQGPAFLDTSRTLMCFAFPMFILGWFGYFCFQKQAGKPEYKWLYQAKVRIQEIAYFAAGSLATVAVVLYGLNQYDYHTNECNFTNIKLDFGFYGTSVAAGLGLISSVMMTVSRDTGLRKTARKTWKSLKLKCKSSKPKIVKLENEEDPSESNDMEPEEVQVKSSKLAKYILPIALIQAACRVKKDVYKKLENVKTPEDGKMNNVVRVIPCNENTDRTEDVLNKKGKDRDQLPPLIKVPPGKMNSTGSDQPGIELKATSLSSVELPIIEPIKGNRNSPRMVQSLNAAPVDARLRENAERRMEKQESPGAERSATNIGRGVEAFVSQKTARKPPITPQRTITHGLSPNANKSSTITTPGESVDSELNSGIYTLPSEPGSVHPSSSINYQDVVTGTQDRDQTAPQPVMTKQSANF